MSKNQILCLLSAIALSATGCATMAGDNTRRVKVDSAPQGASIFIDGKKRGTTPAIVTLPSYIYGGKNIVLKKTNYDDTAVQINSAFQPVSIVNILFPLGFLIDIADGNIVKIDPSDLNVFADLGPRR